MLSREVLDAQYSLCVAALNKGVPASRVLSVAQAEWGALAILKADSGDQTPEGPGAHGIPEIGKEERAFYRALTDEQKRAYDAIRDAVKRMSAREWAAFDPYAIDKPLDDWKQSAMMLLAPAAMRAYLVGQMLAASHMGSAQHLPLGEQDKRAVDFLQHYVFNEISSSFEALKSDLRRHLIQGVYEGKNPNDVAAAIRGELEDYRTTDWETIAITETSRAESQGRLQEFLDEGITYVIGSTAHDSRVCEKCKLLIEGVEVAIRDIIGLSNYGRKQADYLTVIPLHPRCVTGASRVATPSGLRRVESLRPGDLVLTHRGRFRRVNAVAARNYTGAVLGFNGFWVTGEHPILTPTGFREAASLGECADVIGIDAVTWEKIPGNTDDTPTKFGQTSLLSQILSSFLIGPLMPPAAVNLNGDHSLRQCKVDIKALYGVLRDRLQAQVAQGFIHRLLKMGHAAITLSLEGHALQHGLALRLAASGGMGGADLSFTLFDGHSGPFNNLGFGAGEHAQAVALERATQLDSSTPNLSSQSAQRNTADMDSVQFTGLGFGEHGWRPTIRTERISERPFSGHVFDLQVSEDESFIVEGVAVHNCRCVWLPSERKKTVSSLKLVKI